MTTKNLKKKVMFSYSDILQQLEPVGTIDSLSHMYAWLTGARVDTHYYNPNYRGAGPGISICCIAGTFDQPSAFEYIIEELIDDLPEQISDVHLVSFDGRYRGNSIQFFAKQLKHKIQAQRVILLAHSRGGPVATYFAEYLAAKVNVEVIAVISIASPYHGSLLAKGFFSWFSTSVQQMQKKSPLLKELRKKIRESDKKYYFIAGTHDWIVSIDSSHVGKTDRLVVLDETTHISLTHTWKILDPLQNFLAEIVSDLELTEEQNDHNELTFISNSEQSENEKESSEEFIIEMFNQEKDDIVVKRENDFTLIDICADLKKYIDQSSAEKIEVLQKLRQIFESMLNGAEYSPDIEANTVGSFVKAFLEQKEDYLLELSNHKFFKPEKTNFEKFLNKFLTKYEHVSLPIIEKKRDSLGL